MLPGTVDGMEHVCYFRHALALDEKRVKFLPEYAHGGTSLSPDASKATNIANASMGDGAKSAADFDGVKANRDIEEPTSKLPHTKEVWFAGTHSDM
jgi:hypothetical protein